MSWGMGKLGDKRKSTGPLVGHRLWKWTSVSFPGDSSVAQPETLLCLLICSAKGNVPSLAALTNCLPEENHSNGATGQAGNRALTLGCFFFKGILKLAI